MGEIARYQNITGTCDFVLVSYWSWEILRGGSIETGRSHDSDEAFCLASLELYLGL